MLVLLHIIFVILTGLVVLYSDEQAALWIFGKTPVLNQKRITLLHHLVAAGLACLLVTGGLLYIRSVPFYITDPIFVAKQIAIAALILNTWAIDRFSRVATTRAFASLSKKERLPLLLSGGVSIIGWLTAITCGLLLSHLQLFLSILHSL
jgi:hypothetical protein